MTKQLFDTRIKDGLFLIGVVVIVGFTSLSLDDVQGSLRTGKIRCTAYVPSYDVPSDGPVLKPGDAVKMYKKVVGRVLSTDFFVVAVKKPVEDDALPAAAAPAAPPSPAAPSPPPSQLALVSGLKVDVELYKADFAAVLALITPESPVKIESQTLGESALLLMASPHGRPVVAGDRINFPRNHASLIAPTDAASRWGRELPTHDEVQKVRDQIQKQGPRTHVPEPPPRTAGAADNDF
jgi:hypothetical protein